MAEATPRPPRAARLARLGFQRTELAAVSLARLGAEPDTPRRDGRALLDDLTASANPDLAARVLADLLDACEHAPGAWTPEQLLDALHHQEAFRRRLVALAASSRSLGTWLIAHPAELDGLADDARFTGLVDPEGLRADALATVAAAAGERPGGDAAWDALRRFRRREFVRIAVRDLLHTTPGETGAIGEATEPVGRALAALGDACLEAALWLALRQFGDDPPVRIALLGMGKLGGQELNYVSDLDILACHEPAEGSTGSERAARVAARVVRRVVTGLGGVSREGVGYRVDLNLRPEGRDGPLSRTMAAYLAYWDRWAEAWEFQALIKVRPVAGDRELGERFCQEAAGRVYPEQLGADTIAEIRRIKRRVEDSVRARAESERHVKLGTGGIRDIEWAVQLLQLVHARQDPGLRSGSTLTALAALADAQLVGREDAEQLAAAYRFQRTVEHRLQLLDERRTHTLPEDPDEQAWLARILGYRDGSTFGPSFGPSASAKPTRGLGERPDRRVRGSHPGGGGRPTGRALDRFHADYRRHARTVRSLHQKLFYRPLLEVFGAVPPLKPEQARDRLVSLGFGAPDQAVRHLAALTAGLTRSAALMRVALPVLLPSVAASPDPDGGLLQLRSLAEKLDDRPAFLQILRENPVAAEHLCTVLGTSPVLGELLQRHPELVDAFADDRRLLSGGTGAPGDVRAEAVGEALNVVQRLRDTPEAAWDGLRRFRRREFLRAAVREVLGLDRAERAGERLTAVAEACLEAGLWLTLRSFAEGTASGDGETTGRRPPVRLALLGMGKLGGAELHYVSDLDLLACHEPAPGVDPETAATAAVQVVKQLVQGLGSLTREGRGYQLDFKLRPEGQNGPLSRTLPAYLAYWDRWAQTWEFQALVKVRPVAGDRELAGRFCQEAAARVYRDRLDAASVAEIRKMKARVETERLPRGADPKLHLKLGPGGLTDVEWTVQLKQLQLGGRHPEVRVAATRAALARLRALDALTEQDAAWLGDAYDLCTRLRNLGYLVTGRPMDQLPTDPEVLTKLARALYREDHPAGRQPGDADPPILGSPAGRQQLLETYRRATRRARSVVEEQFWGGKL